MPFRPLALLALLGGTATLRTDNWPAWRGPEMDGRSPEKNLAVRWGPRDNVRWKTALPAGGNSSPVVWGDRVFLTQAWDNGTHRAVLCFDRATGKVLWQKDTPYRPKEPTHPTNPYCSASPVTDGQRVVASLGSAGLVCYDFSGKERWRKDLGKLHHVWGNASSPVLYGNLVILWCGPGERQFLLAVDKDTGRTAWRHDEPGGNFGRDPKEWIGSWSTPILIRAGGRDELVVSVPEKVKGFEPKTGKERWSCSGLGKLVYPSPVHAGGVVVALSGFHGPALAVRTGGQGDVTGTHRLWRHARSIPQRIGSPVILGERVYLLNENGVLQCLNLHTGKELARERLAGTFWASLVAADAKLYATSQAGDTFVVQAGPGLRKVARNSLGERVLASPAVADGDLFLRSYQHLWCIRTQKQE